jgi:hypothetical protein
VRVMTILDKGTEDQFGPHASNATPISLTFASLRDDKVRLALVSGNRKLRRSHSLEVA